MQAKVDPDKLTIVIPTKDEEDGIGPTIDELIQMGFEPGQILVVDGDSRDRTVEIARSKGVNVIRQDGVGKADAILTALKNVDTEYMLVMDGDYTYDPSKIGEMLSLMDKYVEVIGARVEGRENIPWINRIGNRILTWIFNTLFGTCLRDVLSGMYMVNVEKAKLMLGKATGFSIEAEIAAHMSCEGDITDIDIRYRKRVGKPKLSILDGVKIGWNIIKLTWYYNPFLLIFTLGTLLLIPGIIIGAYVLYDFIFLHKLHRILTPVSLIFTLAGLISFLFAILFLYLRRMELRVIRAIEKRR